MISVIVKHNKRDICFIGIILILKDGNKTHKMTKFFWGHAKIDL